MAHEVHARVQEPVPNRGDRGIAGGEQGDEQEQGGDVVANELGRRAGTRQSDGDQADQRHERQREQGAAGHRAVEPSRIEQDGLEEGARGAFRLGGFRPGFGFRQAEGRVPPLEAGEAALVKRGGEAVLLLLGEGEFSRPRSGRGVAINRHLNGALRRCTAPADLCNATKDRGVEITRATRLTHANGNILQDHEAALVP